MSILTKLFGSSANEETKKNPIPWKALTGIEQLQNIIEISINKPVAIFKHSTRCGVSRMVLKQFEKNYDMDPDTMDFYFLDLLNYREVSSEIAVMFQILHQSPQLIIIKNGITVASASHYEINNINLEQLIN